MNHRLLLVLAAIVLVAIGAASLVAANVLGAQRVADNGRVAVHERPSGDEHGPEGEFHRFRLGTVNGERLTPNRDDFAARTSADGPLLLFLPATRDRKSVV